MHPNFKVYLRGVIVTDPSGFHFIFGLIGMEAEAVRRVIWNCGCNLKPEQVFLNIKLWYLFETEGMLIETTACSC